MKTLKLFKLLFATLLFTTLMSSCGDDDNTPDMICTFTDNATIDAYIGQKVGVKVSIESYTYQQSDISLFVGDVEVPEFDISMYDSGNEYTFTFKLPTTLTAFDEVFLSLRTKGGRNVQGPKIKVVPAYTSSYFGLENLGVRNMELSWDKDNKITTLTSGFDIGSLKAIHFEGNTIDSSGKPVITFGWEPNLSLPTSPTGATPVTSITGDRFGFDTRNGANYFHLYYTPNHGKGEYYLLQENFGQTNFVGDGFYQQNFGGSITDVRVDKDQNIYVIDRSKPNCIQKLSATKAPIVWVGSATESGNVDGTLTDARFEGVVRMQRDSKDNLYVAQKNVIRKITPQGVVTTLNDFKFEDIATFAIAPDDKIYVLDNKDTSKLHVINAAQSSTYSCTILSYYNIGSPFSIGVSNNMIVGVDGTIYFKTFSSGTGSNNLNILKVNK